MRLLITVTAAVSLALLGASSISIAKESYTTFDKAAQAAVSPDQALNLLKEGNQRFVAGTSLDRDYGDQRALTSKGQFPFASVIACLDSRAAPEILFDQGIGDLFVGRVAGNVINEDLLGSLEFASKVAGSKLIVVLGHTECGAVKGACDNVEMGNLTALLDKIEPAVNQVSGYEGARSSKNTDFVRVVTDLNVKLAVAQITERSQVLAEMVQSGELKVVGAVYDIASGEVIWMN